jgi:hypothetical protein
MTMSKNGAHQLAVRRRSVKVFEGAMNVLTMRAPSESRAGSVIGTGGAKGGSGEAAMFGLLQRCERILAGWRRRDKRGGSNGSNARVGMAV